jgi:hypothetical protein
MSIAPPIALFAFLSAPPAMVAQADVTVTVSPAQLPDAGGTLTVTFSQNQGTITSVTANGDSVNFKQKSPTQVDVMIPPRKSLNVAAGAPISVTILATSSGDGSVAALSTSFTYST